VRKATSPSTVWVSTRHRFLVAGLAAQAAAGPEHDRDDLQPQFVDEVVLHQRAQELEAAGDDDPRVELLLSFETASTAWP
jgi:hypothetical protein